MHIGDLNDIVKLGGKIRTARFSISFYRPCLANRVSPKFSYLLWQIIIRNITCFPLS